jgi:hypothetical protein
MFPRSASRSPIKIFFPALAFLFLLSSCGSGAGGDPNASLSSQSIQTTIGDLKVGSVVSVPLTTGSTSISFSQLTGREQFILSMSSASKTTGTFNAQVGGSVSEASLSRNFSLGKSLLPPPGGGTDASEDTTARFHDYLNQVEQSIPSSTQTERRALAGSTDRQNLSVGDTTTLKVLNSLTSTDNFTTVTVEVKMITPHFIVYKDVQADELSDSDIQSLIGPFENKVDEEYATFGSVSDIDQNGKVGIVFSPVLNQMGGSGGIVTGFFFAGDVNPGVFPASNGGEFIYCHVPDESGRWGVPVSKSFYLSNTGPLCFPHELQHAINYNMKVFEHKGNAEPSPFNEGQSHFAEDIYSDFSQAGPENPSRVGIYFNSGMPSFIEGISLADRGGAYLFYRYLYEQADLGRYPGVTNGADLMRRIHDTDKSGFDSIEDVTGVTLASIFSDFFSALPLSNTPFSTDARFNFKGINLRSPQNDNRNTVLSGPPVSVAKLPVNLSVPAASSQYLLVQGSALQRNGNSLNLNSDLAGNPVATLIRIEDQ